MKKVLVFITTAFSIFGLYWINSGQTSLKQTGEVAGREEIINYTLPPGFIFSIWGLIYLGFIIYAIVGLTKKAESDDAMSRTAYPVALSIFLNLVWTVVVGLDLWAWAFPIQGVMLAIAVVIMYKWRLGEQPLSVYQKYLSIPFALYTGWLTVAMIPFAASLLNRSGWNFEPFEPITWAIIIYILACVIVIIVQQRLRQPFILLPLAWALFGYYTRFDGILEITAIGLAVGVFVFFLLQLHRFYSARASAHTRRGPKHR